ncbi:protease inhibitor I9 family protein, partial [Streptomyces diastatochromogenes]|uniref:protease inhibitor I9 family protein n=1 Tax=Streptomyces diastatochromogenes TaxID=42236 RepID=UPI001ABEFE1D
MTAHHKRISKAKTVTAIAAAATVVGTALYVSPAAQAGQPAEGKVYGLHAEGAVAGSFVVLLDQKASAAEKKDLATEYGGRISRTFGSAVNGFSADSLTETEAKRLAADPAVATVVQNKKFHIDATQDNPPSWGLDRIDQTDTAGDHKYTYPDKAGEGVTAYVIDTG